jgi:hypothetical protein
MTITKSIRPALYIILGITMLCSLPGLARARQESVADAARRAQSQKKTPAKSGKVFTNEDLGDLKGTVSVVGQEPAPPPAPATDKDKVATDKVAADKDTTAGATADAKKAPVKDEAYWRQQFADARKKLADDAHEADILQREYNLKQQQYYSDPNTALREQFTRKDLTDTKQKIDDKTVDVNKDKQAISDLEDALRAAGGDAGWSRP